RAERLRRPGAGSAYLQHPQARGVPASLPCLVPGRGGDRRFRDRGLSSGAAAHGDAGEDMTLPVNTFKSALREGRQQVGIWNTIPGPVVAELLAGAGFDWMVLDTEHSLTDIPDLMGMLQAVAPYPVAPVVRPQANDTVLIKRALDLGAQTLLLPYVQTKEEAEAAVRAMRYAPRGIRGVSGMTRASRFGAVKDYVKRAEEELCLIVQVETGEAVARIEEI